MPPSTIGRVKFGSFDLYVGNEAVLSGTEDDVQLSEALAALTGAVSIGGDSVTIPGDVVIQGTTKLEDSVTADNLALADGANGVLYRDLGAGNVVKVSI